MNVSLWSSKNLLSVEWREQLHIRQIKKAERVSAFGVGEGEGDYAGSFSLSVDSVCFGTSTVGLLSIRVTSSWSIR